MLFATALPAIAADVYDFTYYENDNKELLRIERHKDKVKRKGDTLYLKTETNADVVIKNAPECDTINACTNVFIDYIEDKGFYLVYSNYGEGTTYAFISIKDGKKFYTHDRPIFSPDGNRMVVGYPDYAYDEKEDLLWEFKDGIPVPVLTHEILGKHIARHTFIGWEDNKTMIFTKGRYQPDKRICPDSDYITLKITLKLEKDAWKLIEGRIPEDITCKNW